MGFMFPDKSFEIHDSTSDNQIGTIRESMKFLEVEDIPKDIYKIRMAQAQHDVGYEVKLESIIRYSKEVKIRHETIAKQHTRNQNLHDIMKFNIRNFIQYADDPIRYEKWYNKETGKVEEIECIKVYHLNLVMHMEYIDAKGNKKETYKKIRVIMTQDGIKDVIEPPFQL